MSKQAEARLNAASCVSAGLDIIVHLADKNRHLQHICSAGSFSYDFSYPLFELQKRLRSMLADHIHIMAKEVCQQDFFAFGNLAFKSEGRSEGIARAGGVRPLIATLETHASAPGVTKSACYALLNLTGTGSDTIRETIIDAGAVGPLIAALTAHATDPGVVEQASGALWNLSVYHDALGDAAVVCDARRDTVVRAGAVPPPRCCLAHSHRQRQDQRPLRPKGTRLQRRRLKNVNTPMRLEDAFHHLPLPIP